MEAESLPDGRIRLVLSRRENNNISYALLEALSWLRREDSEFHAHVGLASEEAGALEDEWSILERQLFGLPDPGPWSSSEILMDRYKEYVESLPEEPRETGTEWDDLPRIEVELLPDGRVDYALARGELSIFAGLIEVMLVKVVKDRDVSSRGEMSARRGETIEVFEVLRDELWQADHRLRGSPKPDPIFDPPRPKLSSGCVGDVATFVVQHRSARVWSRECEPITDERMQYELTADGRARIVVSPLHLKRMYAAFWPWHSMYWDEPDFVGSGGASAEQAQELRFEIDRIRTWLDEEWRERWAKHGVTLCEVVNGRIVPSNGSKEERRVWGMCL